MKTPTAYPLQWPQGWPREGAKENGRFRSTLSAALSSLRKEIDMLGGKSMVLSSNVTLGAERPKDPGVVAYFTLRDQSIAIPCDRWNRVEDNVKAIALTVEAMRGMERWGAKHMITAMFNGFAALPERTGPSCWEILGISPNASVEKIMQAWRDRAQVAHPDKGGTHDAMSALNDAKDIAIATARSR